MTWVWIWCIYVRMHGHLYVCFKRERASFFLAKLALLVPCVSVCMCVLVFCIESAVCSRTRDLVPSAQWCQHTQKNKAGIQTLSQLPTIPLDTVGGPAWGSAAVNTHTHVSTSSHTITVFSTRAFEFPSLVNTDTHIICKRTLMYNQYAHVCMVATRVPRTPGYLGHNVPASCKTDFKWHLNVQMKS